LGEKGTFPTQGTWDNKKILGSQSFPRTPGVKRLLHYLTAEQWEEIQTHLLWFSLEIYCEIISSK
jgi:hypothetical protein